MNRKKRLLDVCCGAGGASAGYERAGFEVTGVDILPQKHYPTSCSFIQAEAIQFIYEYGHEFDAIAGSPPCQFGSELTPKEHKAKHPNLIPTLREALKATGKPYIIENVEGVRKHLIDPVMLCGSMFGLQIWRHRYFETNFGLAFSPATCNHGFHPVLASGLCRKLVPVLRSGRGMRQVEGKRRKENTADEKRAAMGISWMIETELTLAIPPAYTEWLGKQLLAFLEN